MLSSLCLLYNRGHALELFSYPHTVVSTVLMGSPLPPVHCCFLYLLFMLPAQPAVIRKIKTSQEKTAIEKSFNEPDITTPGISTGGYQLSQNVSQMACLFGLKGGVAKVSITAQPFM
jgi:hypothetical protein